MQDNLKHINQICLIYYIDSKLTQVKGTIENKNTIHSIFLEIFKYIPNILTVLFSIPKYNNIDIHITFLGENSCTYPAF